MKTIEEIFNQALQDVKKGASPNEAASKWPEHADQLIPFLQTAQKLWLIPKNQIPEPQMRRKFITAPAKTWVLSAWIHAIRFSTASIAVMLFITGVGGTAYATFHSLPGQALFPLKKTAERVQLHLTSDPVAKASIQISITQKRLDEVEKVFKNPARDSAQEIAALTELSKQTTETASTVKKATTSNSFSGTDHPVVDSFAAVTKKQQVLLNGIKSQKDIKVATNSAFEATKEAKKVIAVFAATNDQASLIKLNATPNTVAISGTINVINKDSVTVEKTTFTINDKTEIKNSDEETLKAENLSPKTVVNITGLKDNGVLYAKEIVIIVPDDTALGEVKGDSTHSTSTPASTSTVAKPSPTSTQPTTKKTESFSSAKKPETEASSTPIHDPNAAIGTFILEDPNPQFAP
jgi:hypothetical protein